jgi:predicted transcriptional regulator
MSPASASQGNPEAGESDDDSVTGRFREEQELLHRHIRILQVVTENEPVGIIKLADLTDYPQHKVRYSLRVLEQEGLINPTPMGAKTTEKVQEFLPELAELVDEMQDTINSLKDSL